jgi:hypothetical protein
MKRLFFVAVILVAVGKANAAEITYAPRGDSFIDISIHGAIAENDDRRFHEIEKAVSAFDSTKTITENLTAQAPSITADQSRCHRPCQQARPNGLGIDGQGRAIQLSGRVMQSRSIRRSGQPTWAIAFSNAGF